MSAVENTKYIDEKIAHIYYLNVLGTNYQAEIKINSRYGDRLNAKSNKIFLDGVISPHEVSKFNKRYYMEQLKPGPRGLNADYDKSWDRYNRREVKLNKLFLNTLRDHADEIMRDYMTQAGWDKMVWNNYAGCSTCKCSPGFNMRGDKVKNTAFYVTFSERTV